MISLRKKICLLVVKSIQTFKVKIKYLFSGLGISPVQQKHGQLVPDYSTWLIHQLRALEKTTGFPKIAIPAQWSILTLFYVRISAVRTRACYSKRVYWQHVNGVSSPSWYCCVRTNGRNVQKVSFICFIQWEKTHAHKHDSYRNSECERNHSFEVAVRTCLYLRDFSLIVRSPVLL